MNLAVIEWDPAPHLFVLPIVNHPITWYGVLFAFGVVVAYFLVRHLFALDFKHQNIENPKEKAAHLVDRLSLFAVIGGILGARLGHVFFYGWPYYSQHLADIFKVWEGGLASHGGAVGVLGALFFFWIFNKKKFPGFSFMKVLDAVVVGTAFFAGCVRIGNFFNQEILGIPTALPWGVLFGHPFERAPSLPLHPVQLYESVFYFFTFALLWMVWKKRGRVIGEALVSGLFFAVVFGFRFIIEFLKLPQSESLSADPILNMGQILSLPLFVLGLFFLAKVVWGKKNER